MSYVVKPTPRRKYVRDLQARLPKGYRIGLVYEDSGGNSRLVVGHPAVVTPDGQLLRGADGRPVTVAGTPGSVRSFRKDLRGIFRAIEAS